MLDDNATIDASQCSAIPKITNFESITDWVIIIKVDTPWRTLRPIFLDISSYIFC
jgi:hypothetical protein